MSLSTKKDVDVIVNLSPRALPRNGFNIGLLLGKTNVFEENVRTKAYADPDEMLEDGFALSDPLYLGAVEYFKQQDNLGASLSEVVIGAVKQVTTVTPLYAWTNGSTIYTVTASPTAGDTIYTAQGQATENTVASVTTSGDDVTAITVSSTSYSRASGSDTAFSTSEYENYEDALVACRDANADWYGFAVVDNIDDDTIEDIADAVEALEATMYIAVTTDNQNADDGYGVIYNLAQKKYDRTIVTYKESVYFGCGLLGYAMGANTGLINSAYSLKYKQIVGQEASNLTTTQVNHIENNYGNCYVKRADAQYEQGTCASGTWFDEMINLDKLVNDITLNVYDLLYSLPKEPQTEAGHADIAGVIGQACEQARKIGFIGEGLKWRRPSILALSKGDVLPSGYLVQWEDVNEQSDADRDARKSMPFYVCITLAGAIHSVVIQVNVSR